MSNDSTLILSKDILRQFQKHLIRFYKHYKRLSCTYKHKRTRIHNYLYIAK